MIDHRARLRGLLARVVGELRAAAARSGLSPHDLAPRTGYSADAVARCLRGDRPYLRVVHALDAALGPRLDSLDRVGLDAAYALAGLDVPRTPPHPLAEALGPGWLWLSRPESATVVVLAPSGAWAEVSLLPDLSLAQWRAMGAAIGARADVPGRFVAHAGETAVAPCGFQWVSG